LNGTVYVGTDVGVFASSTASPNWTEVGPSPGQNGFLPNVPVTALKIFHAGATKLLRASTYGRGLWQFPLTTAANFQVAVPDPIQTVFFSQTAVFNGALTSLNGYKQRRELELHGWIHRSSNDLHDLLFSLTPNGVFTGHSKRSAWRLFFQAACGGSSTEQHHLRRADHSTHS